MSNERAPKGFVTIGVAAGHPKPHFCRTMFDLAVYDREHGGQHLNPTRPAIWITGASMIVNARNQIVREFLAMPEPRSDWLLMLDDDQEYPAQLLDRLLYAADSLDRRIVGMPVWRFVKEDDGVRSTHNVFDITPDGFFVERTEPLPDNALIPVAAIGTGCLLVHRTALEDIATFGAEQGLGERHVWFQHRVHPADFAEGEDLYFCRLAGGAEITVWCLTSYVLEHTKEIRLDRAFPVGALLT